MRSPGRTTASEETIQASRQSREHYGKKTAKGRQKDGKKTNRLADSFETENIPQTT
ncbi:MAG: hypothetical protein ACI4UO_00070 [Paludibacteraceae bacterium]